MDLERSIDNILEPYLNDKYLTHAYVESGFLFSEKQIFSKSYGGSSDFSCFDLASLTKALVTGPLVHWLVAYHRVNYEDAAGHHLSGLPDKIKSLSIQSLLSHRSGLPPWRNFWINRIPGKVCDNFEQRLSLVIDVLHRIQWKHHDGELYSDMGYIILGMMIEALEKKNLAEIFSSYKTEVLGFYNNNINYQALLKTDLDFVPSGFCSIRNAVLKGQVHDENCAVLGGESGHCGLFATGPALGEYLRALYGNAYGFDYFEKNEKERLNTGKLLGFRLADDESSIDFGKGRAIGHMGFTGTAFWVDWPSKKYGILLTNRTISGRISKDIKRIRKNIFSLLYKAEKP